MRRRLVVALAVLVGFGVDAGRSHAYWYDGPSWQANPVMSLQLGSSSNGVTLIDGSTTWGQPAEAAMAIWNQYLDRVQFRVIRDATSATGLGNGINNVFWSNSIYGRSWESYAGYTLWRSSGNAIIEADVIMNNQLSWNSYRGTARSGNVDFRRLVMHELGHAIGLNHPNDHGQVVTAVMNSSPGNTDTVMADDISGAQFLYSIGGNGSVSFPPRNESLDFRNQLETKYRDGLRRGNSTTYVDREGDIVWISEYYRYRVNACSHAQAQTRVFAQIDNTGTFGVCGTASSGAVAFPPRNEALDFRIALEAKYRDDLRRGAGVSAVDNEGDVVWIQEYLRYRVNSCSHAVAVDKVFAQIDGRGVQAVCR
ncbi:MAG: matrixin family metalloprotease [Vicinamibacterales bacterium]